MTGSALPFSRTVVAVYAGFSLLPPADLVGVVGHPLAGQLISAVPL